MIKATLDTNILVSALIAPVGKPAQIVARARQGELALCLSEDIFRETDIALRRQHIQKRFHPSDDGIQEFLSALRGICQFISVSNVENLIPQDPPDNLVLACAVEGEADYLVSGNLHLLNLKQHLGVKIITPNQFLKILESINLFIPHPRRHP